MVLTLAMDKPPASQNPDSLVNLEGLATLQFMHSNDLLSTQHSKCASFVCVQVHVLHQMFPSNSSEVEAAYSWKDAFRWLQQIVAALKYLHGLRPMVVHRDLKLENLLLTGSNPGTADAKLADFGLCKLVKVGLQFVDFGFVQAGKGLVDRAYLGLCKLVRVGLRG